MIILQKKSRHPKTIVKNTKKFIFFKFLNFWNKDKKYIESLIKHHDFQKTVNDFIKYNKEFNKDKIFKN